MFCCLKLKITKTNELTWLLFQVSFTQVILFKAISFSDFSLGMVLSWFFSPSKYKAHRCQRHRHQSLYRRRKKLSLFLLFCVQLKISPTLKVRLITSLGIVEILFEVSCLHSSNINYPQRLYKHHSQFKVYNSIVTFDICQKIKTTN